MVFCYPAHPIDSCSFIYFSFFSPDIWTTSLTHARAKCNADRFAGQIVVLRVPRGKIMSLINPLLLLLLHCFALSHLNICYKWRDASPGAGDKERRWFAALSSSITSRPVQDERRLNPLQAFGETRPTCWSIAGIITGKVKSIHVHSNPKLKLYLRRSTEKCDVILKGEAGISCQ